MSLNAYLVLSVALLGIGLTGVYLNRRNVIILMLSVELMLLGSNFSFVAFSHYFGNLTGQLFVFFVLTVAAAEAAIGLAILVLLFRTRGTIEASDLDSLQG